MASLGAYGLEIAVFVLVVASIAALLFGLRSAAGARVDPLARRIQTSALPRAPSMPAPARERPEPTAASTLLDAALKPVVSVAKPADEAELQGLRSRLSHAGYRSERALYWYLSSKVFLCLGGAALYLIYDAQRAQPDNQAALYTIIAMIVGFYAPSLWLNQRVRDRQQELERALPDALDLLVTCVEAGLGLDSALNRIAGESGMASRLLEQELLQTSREMRAGLGRGEAMRRLASRTGVAELKYLASVVVQTEIFGTSVAKSLRMMSDGMRIRRSQRSEERAATVAVKMTLPLVLCILPSLFTVLLGPAVLNVMSTLLPQLGGGAQ